MNTQTIKMVSWYRAAPQFLASLLSGYLVQISGIFSDWVVAYLVGFAIVAAYRSVIGFTILRDLNQGIRLAQEKQYEKAVEALQKSLHYFKEHPNLDEWRTMLFLSSGEFGYRELSLLNLGFVYVQLNELKQAREAYWQVLDSNQTNPVANAGIRILDAKRYEDLSIVVDP